MIHVCEDKQTPPWTVYGLSSGITDSECTSCQFCGSADLRQMMSPIVIPRNCPVFILGVRNCCSRSECCEGTPLFRRGSFDAVKNPRSLTVRTGTDYQFRAFIKDIRLRGEQLITGYWFNIIEIAGYQFLQGPIDSSCNNNKDDLGLALAFGKLHPAEMAGFWPKVVGYPLTKDEEEYFINYISAQEGKDVELIVPLRNQARSVYWLRFEDSKEYPVYAESIYPQILEAVRETSFNCILDVGCGSGNLLSALRKRYPGASFYGLDISLDNVEVAREKGFPHVYEGDARFLDKAFSKEILFDLIIFSGVLNRQIMDFQAALTIIEKSLTLLSPGGHILITGFSSCHLTALDLAGMGLTVLKKSIPENIFKKYDKFYLRQLYLTRKEKS